MDLGFREGRTRPSAKPKIHMGIDMLFVDVPENLYVLRNSISSLNVFVWNKRFSTCILQMPTSITMAPLFLHTLLIPMSLDKITIGHTQRTFTLPNSGLA